MTGKVFRGIRWIGKHIGNSNGNGPFLFATIANGIHSCVRVGGVKIGLEGICSSGIDHVRREWRRRGGLNPTTALGLVRSVQTHILS